MDWFDGGLEDVDFVGFGHMLRIVPKFSASSTSLHHLGHGRNLEHHKKGEGRVREMSRSRKKIAMLR
eukprot:7458799-Pyramimonas_sp.AAC.1